jgi:dihydrofolate synthase / folylpolyglutamate synthase
VTLTQSTLDYLYSLQTFGMKLGLRNIRALLRFCQDPHKRFRSVHIAGTNGKGSTSCMIAAVLQAAGYRVGLYTSPHLVKFNERIRIDGEMISDSDLVRYAKLFRPRIDALKATFFEATTAIAFKYFADKNVDFAVVETGLGGRLDATNVLVPEVSVITSISKDHTQQLGTSLLKIAFEKGGIIKRGRACVVGVKNRRALRELRRIAKRRRSQFITIDKVRSSRTAGENKYFQIVNIKTENNSYNNLRISLLGKYQVRNAKVAITTLEYLRARGVIVTESSLRQGFEYLRQMTGIRGRFEILRPQPLVILDLGHNPEAVSATVAALQNLRYREVILVFGVMKDKDYGSMIRSLAALRPAVFAVQPATERALSALTIATLFSKKKCAVCSFRDVAEGVRKALRTQKENDLLLICGSHYVVGEVLRLFPKGLYRKSS